MRRISHWIGGKPWDGDADRGGDVSNPATGEVTARVDFAGSEVIDEAVTAASAAFTDWRRASLARRAAVLFAFRELLDGRKDELAAIITAEHG